MVSSTASSLGPFGRGGGGGGWRKQPAGLSADLSPFMVLFGRGGGLVALFFLGDSVERSFEGRGGGGGGSKPFGRIGAGRFTNGIFLKAESKHGPLQPTVGTDLTLVLSTDLTANRE